MTAYSTQKPLAILLVDDDEVAFTAQYKTLESLGHTIDSARNGLQAVVYCRLNKYDIVILDCGLPDIDGFEVCRRIRANEQKHAQKPMPIIMLSAYPKDRAIEQACGEAGIDEYFNKPVFKNDFENIFRRLIK